MTFHTPSLARVQSIDELRRDVMLDLALTPHPTHEDNINAGKIYKQRAAAIEEFKLKNELTPK